MTAETMQAPNPTHKYPLEGFSHLCFIKNTVANPNIVIGDYTYYYDPENSEDFERNVLYHYPFIGDRLIIGRFCAIACGVKFIMNGANHKASDISTYPFQIFDNGSDRAAGLPELPYKGDTIVGNDVWFGHEALVMPGVRIGNGAIISARAVVVEDVPPFTVVSGNPAEPVQQRFSPADIKALEAIAWWDWPVEKITRHLSVIGSGDVEALVECALEG